MRGGYRPNSGPAKGTKYRPRKPKPGQPSATIPAKKPRKPKADRAPAAPPEPTDQDKIRQMMEYGVKARNKIYTDFINRVGKGEKLTVAEINKMEKIGEELRAEVNGEKPPATVDGKIETPLEFMLRIMNDTSQPEEYRARMAVSSAPFMHPRKGEGLGKKDEKQEKAKTAGAGRFSSMANRLKVVK